MKDKKRKNNPQQRVYRRAHERITKIHKEIASGIFPNARQLAELAEVHERTVKRDLAALRDEYDAPIKYNRKKGGYYFSDSMWTLPPLKLAEGDLLAFFIAENALKFTGQTPEALKLRHSLQKIAAFLPNEVSVNLAVLGENVTFQNLPFAEVETNILNRLAASATGRQTVEFDYYSPHRRQNSHRTADVHLLHNFAGDWFAISYDHTRSDFRDFHVGRLSNLKETNKYFKRQKNWDAGDYLKRGFSMMRGGRLTTVVIHFDPFQAQWIREREFFHPEEIREELEDGSLRLSFKIGEKGLQAVARFCLQYAGNCKVEKPKKLREIIRKKLEEGLRQHSD